MPLPVRRSVGEVITRLELEPTVWDIYVEGPSDAALVDWVLRRSGRGQYKVFPIDDIELPSASSDEQPGARDRVIRLAELLAEHFGVRIAPVICLADRDLDVLSGRPAPDIHVLLLTDHSSLDVHYFDPRVIDRFLTLFVRRRVAEPVAILSALRPVLEEVFLVRAADRHLGLRCGALSPDRCCEFGTAGLVVFNRDDYITRYLGRAGLLARRQEFEQAIEDFRGCTDETLVHAHDFVEMLCATLRPFVNEKRVVIPEVATRALMTCLDEASLATTDCFRHILERIPPPRPR